MPFHWSDHANGLIDFQSLNNGSAGADTVTICGTVITSGLSHRSYIGHVVSTV